MSFTTDVLFIQENIHAHIIISLCRSVLKTSKVSPTATSDLQPILTQACEDGLVPFVRALLDYGVEVSQSLALFHK